MKFSRWFESIWKEGKHESKTRAVYRLCIETDVSLPTVERALRGDPIRAPQAEALAEASRGAVDAASLVFPEVGK